jgi:hypothetical protein
MFVSSRRLTFLDYFRTPYQVARPVTGSGIEQLKARAGGAALLWPIAGTASPAVAATVQGADGETGIPIFASVVSDDIAESLLGERSGRWSPARTVVGAHGEPLAAIWHGEDGSVFLPFDPDEVIVNYWSERYTQIARGPHARRFRQELMAFYYRLRPLLPRSLQIWLRRHPSPAGPLRHASTNSSS